MWKYRHFVKENPKSGYDWSATGQWQTAFCVCQREHWECWRSCVQPGRQSKNAPIESRDLMWNWQSLIDCTQNNLSRSPAQLCQTMSLTAAVWNQSCCPSDLLQAAAAAVRGTVWLHMVQGWKVFTVEPPFNSQNDWVYAQLITRSDTSIPAVCYACRLCCPFPCHMWVWLNWYLSTLGWRWTASITAMSCCLSRCFQLSNVSQNVVYSQNNMLLTAKLVIFCVLWFPKVR